MNDMHSKQHWENVYATKAANSVGWYQEHAELSLELIKSTGAAKDAGIIDVGGGASTLVDDLLAEGYSDLTVLDLSGAALQAARKRLGQQADKVRWVEADVTQADLPANRYDVWHDRAVFHFLIAAEQRRAYVRAVQHAVKPGGHVIVATFAEDGPEQCSGLPVMRYRPHELHDEFGGAFELLDYRKDAHRTPSGTAQQFTYCRFRLTGAGA